MLVCPNCSKPFKNVKYYNRHIIECGKENNSATKTMEKNPVAIATTTPFEKVLEAMQCLEEGYNPLEIMQKLSITPTEMSSIIAQWKQLYALMESKTTDIEYFVSAAGKIGEYARGRCTHYDPETGVCLFWEIRGLDEEERKKYRVLYRTVGRATRFHVYKYPFICSICTLNSPKIVEAEKK